MPSFEVDDEFLYYPKKIATLIAAVTTLTVFSLSLSLSSSSFMCDIRRYTTCFSWCCLRPFFLSLLYGENVFNTNKWFSWEGLSLVKGGKRGIERAFRLSERKIRVIEKYVDAWERKRCLGKWVSGDSGGGRIMVFVSAAVFFLYR